MRRDARAKTLPGAACLGRPANLSDRGHAWQCKKHHRADVAHRLTPDRRFDAKDIAFSNTLYVRGRIPVVGIPHLNVCGPVQTELGGRRVFHVEINLRRWRQNQLGAARQRRRRGIALPLLCDRRRVETRLGDFLPTDHSLAVLVHNTLHALDELDVLVVRQGLNLVAADVEVRARSNAAYFANDIIDETVGVFLVDAETAPTDVGPSVEPGRPAAAGKLRIGYHRGIDVTRHVDL